MVLDNSYVSVNPAALESSICCILSEEPPLIPDKCDIAISWFSGMNMIHRLLSVQRPKYKPRFFSGMQWIPSLTNFFFPSPEISVVFWTFLRIPGDCNDACCMMVAWKATASHRSTETWRKTFAMRWNIIIIIPYPGIFVLNSSLEFIRNLSRIGDILAFKKDIFSKEIWKLSY